jgi:hypothetical protein
MSMCYEDLEGKCDGFDGEECVFFWDFRGVGGKFLWICQ